MISIHALREGSDCGWLISFDSGKISIHALREGSDGKVVFNLMQNDIFQSTLSARGATPAATVWGALLVFQSTLSARGATEWLARNARPNSISIHALREGSDP